MGIPCLNVWSPGIGAFSSDWGNTAVQGGAMLADLRTFIGINGMSVYLIGFSAQGDGGQGMFVWNSGVTGTDDGGVTTIVPYGTAGAPGCWLRQTPGYIISTGVNVVTNIASLRAATIATLPSQGAFVEGYFVGADGGEGMFWDDPTDTTSTDNGGTIIVDASGRRWYRESVRESLSVLWFGATGLGVNDDTFAIQAALNAARPGQEVWLSQTGQHLINSANLNIPVGVQLRGAWNVPGTTANSSGTGQPLVLSALNSALILNSAYTISVQSGAGIRGVPIYRSGLVVPTTSSAAFAGTAISVQGDDVYLGYLLVLGFAQLSTSTTQVRGKYEWIFGDNNAGISIINAYDTPYIHHCHFWPFCTYSSTATLAYHHRTGTAYTVDGTALPSMAHNFCFAYLTGYQLSGSGGATLVDCQADNDAAYFGTIGFSLGTLTAGITSSKLIGCTAFNHTTGYYINTGAGDYCEFSSCSSDGCSAAVNLTSGVIRWIGGVWSNATSGITVVAPTGAVVLDGLKTVNISGATVTDTGGSGLIYVSPSCDFDTLPPGYSISSTMVPNVIASASPLLLSAWGDVYQVTGTTAFGIVNGGWAGRKVTLIFMGIITITNSAVANGVRLSGSTNFTTATGSTLSLVHNGTSWYETGRCA